MVFVIYFRDFVVVLRSRKIESILDGLNENDPVRN